MPRKCCVTNCSSNYKKTGESTTVYRLPKDENERKKWLNNIPRDNIPDTNNTVVCLKHWPTDFRKIRVNGKLRPASPPSIFDCVKSSLLPTRSSEPRKTKRALASIRNIQVSNIII
jgi:hypothetical protein